MISLSDQVKHDKKGKNMSYTIGNALNNRELIEYDHKRHDPSTV